jgi:hypothetical protein
VIGQEVGLMQPICWFWECWLRYAPTVRLHCGGAPSCWKNAAHCSSCNYTA